VANTDGSHPVQMTTMGGPPTSNPRWSPNGRMTSFNSRREGSSDLYLLDPSTSAWRRPTTDPANEVEARWSRDGQWIYFSSDRTGRNELWKMPVAGGAPIQLTRHGGLAAYESPNSPWIYYSKDGASPTTIWKVPRSGGEETPVTDGLSYSLNFAVADQDLYWMAARGGPDRTSIKFLDFATGRTATLLPLHKPWYGFALSPDQRSLLYAVVDSAGSNLMLVENFQK
jgi:dipeptidyl aminopeptidase/acylaminoacyl peptidase